MAATQCSLLLSMPAATPMAMMRPTPAPLVEGWGDSGVSLPHQLPMPARLHCGPSLRRLGMIALPATPPCACDPHAGMVPLLPPGACWGAAASLSPPSLDAAAGGSCGGGLGACHVPDTNGPKPADGHSNPEACTQSQSTVAEKEAEAAAYAEQRSGVVVTPPAAAAAVTIALALDLSPYSGVASFFRPSAGPGDSCGLPAGPLGAQVHHLGLRSHQGVAANHYGAAAAQGVGAACAFATRRHLVAAPLMQVARALLRRQQYRAQLVQGLLRRRTHLLVELRKLDMLREQARALAAHVTGVCIAADMMGIRVAYDNSAVGWQQLAS